MNDTDRKTLSKLHARASVAFAELQEIQSELSAMAEAEREKFDNMTEGLQASENGQKLEEAADKLDELSSAFENACNEIDGVMGTFEDL